jgi:hypothetical protein
MPKLAYSTLSGFVFGTLIDVPLFHRAFRI